MPELKKEDLEKSEEELQEAAEKLEVEQAEAAKVEEKLEEKTAERLETVFEKGESLDEEPEPSPKEEPSTPELAEKPAEKPDEDDTTAPDKDKPGDETKDGDKAKDEEADKGKDEEKVPPLSDAYYRAAIHSGWKSEVIEAQYKANPELTVQTLGSIYETLKKSSNEFAAFGRAEKARVAATVETPTATEVVAQKESEFKGVNIEALKKTDVDPDVIAVVEAMNQQNKLQFDELQGLKAIRSAPVAAGQPSGLTEAQVRAVNQESAMIEQQIETFFRSGDLKGYEDFYGTLAADAIDWNSLTPGQKMNRWTVIEMMDQMMTGARALGREMKIDEALTRSHLSVTEPIREKVIREDIIAKVTERGKNLTLKPSGTAQPTEGKPQTAQELESVTTERLKKVYG